VLPPTAARVSTTHIAALELEEEGWGAPDFYGNEVSEAVAKYKLDGDGSLYEVHSPQTELPRLASPLG
jgi:hypothetical protein